MSILNKCDKKDFPFDWVNLDSLPDSNGKRLEIYLLEEEGHLEGLILMFYTLFGDLKHGIKIYDKLWWDFCWDTWNIHEDSYDYSLEGKSSESKAYLTMLEKSGIEMGYSGSITCTDWDYFLPIILACILTHQAPYSPHFYNTENNFFFYFHHTGSIGFYYQSDNEIIHKLLDTANEEYELIRRN